MQTLQETDVGPKETEKQQEIKCRMHPETSIQAYVNDIQLLSSFNYIKKWTSQKKQIKEISCNDNAKLVNMEPLIGNVSHSMPSVDRRKHKQCSGYKPILCTREASKGQSREKVNNKYTY